MIWHIYDYFKTEPGREKIFTQGHLLKLQWPQPETATTIQEFNDTWDMMMDNMLVKVDEATEENFYYDQIRKSSILQPSVDHYTREKMRGSESYFQQDVSLTYLRGVAERWLAQQEYDANLATQEAEFDRIAQGRTKKHPKGPAMPAPGAKVKPQAKPKPKVKPQAKPKPKVNPERPVRAPSVKKDDPANHPRPNATFEPREDPRKRCFFHNLSLHNG